MGKKKFSERKVSKIKVQMLIDYYIGDMQRRGCTQDSINTNRHVLKRFVRRSFSDPIDVTLSGVTEEVVESYVTDLHNRKVRWKNHPNVAPAPGKLSPFTIRKEIKVLKGFGTWLEQEGLEGFATEMGAGQWGSALCFAAQLFGLQCKVSMVTISYHQKPYRRVMMETWGGNVVPSPISETKAGRDILEVDPETTGSLGIAISEAVEYAVTHDGFKYSLGSVLNFVLMHQTVIGLEALKQLEMAGDYPDILIGCAGGGSNTAGLIYPFLKDKLSGDKPDLRAIFVESTACPSMTKGIYAYD
ncbi:MAG: pyridoxal-phosphate dependent enzyme, partial [Anaerolineales bacterium]|nr:pyridoxal-phosphate dependent enzyme [Anaerolineales bacterium]